jgi:hypothetical protein
MEKQKDVIELADGLTPGEQFQNWLAKKGIGEPVGERTLYQPEPPPGVWIMVNGGIAFCTMAIAGYLLWQVATKTIPAITHYLAA